MSQTPDLLAAFEKAFGVRPRPQTGPAYTEAEERQMAWAADHVDDEAER